MKTVYIVFRRNRYVIDSLSGYFYQREVEEVFGNEEDAKEFTLNRNVNNISNGIYDDDIDYVYEEFEVN